MALFSHSLTSCLPFTERNPKPYRLKLLHSPPDVPLLCACTSSNSHSFLSIFSLSENGSPQECCVEEFHDWSHANSILRCTLLMCHEIPHTVQLIDTELIQGAAYLCVVCSYRLMVYQVPASTGVMSWEWMDHPVIHKSSCKIAHAKLRYTRMIET